jgi:hypothetical protein
MSGRLTFICVFEANLALSCAPSARRWPLRLFISQWTARWSAFSAKPAGAGAVSHRLIPTGEHSNTASGNTAVGYQTLYYNTSGISNTATGVQALWKNSSGTSNTATGYFALLSNTTGCSNTASGDSALSSNTTGGANTGIGYQALFSNINGNVNTAHGDGALYFNTAGSNDTAVGYQALFNNTSGRNTAIGVNALYNNTTGNVNTAVGYQALNNTGSRNTAFGVNALLNNTTALNNTAIGYQTLLNNTGGNNIAIGSGAGGALTTGSSNIDIANGGVAGESSTIRIGSAQTRSFFAGIRGVTTTNANAVPVVIDSAGQLGTVTSSERFKKEIKPMAICNDGWESHATRGGTCSYHGGVRCWKYSDGACTNP